ncbi:hypothetical protein [Luteimonas sp. R10]|uniref:hypothetical protein n=1 Tax=Luteimonas sp. R10 TaxID=3108176 RepID=UPI00309349E9|nr:hypothetical protein U3649_14510 [Luteimonas sp. R10]
MAASKTAHFSADPNLRHAWLASLGLIAVARREAGNALANTAAAADRLQRRAAGYAVDALDIARGGVLTLRERIEPRVAGFGAEFEARLAPVLGKLGSVASPSRKPASKTARRAAPRRTAKPASTRTRG